MKFEHISLGPTCLPAYILKIGNLRKASYPFDWARTGSIHVCDIFKMEPSVFYYSHIHQPSIKLEQPELPNKTNSFTAPLHQRDSIWGFPYLYNPHRPLGESKDYFLRCLQRFRDVVSSPHCCPSFLLADYEAKCGHTFLDQVNLIHDNLIPLLDQNVCNNYRLTILRITTSPKTHQFSTEAKVLSLNNKHKATLIKVLVHEDLDQTYASADGDFMSSLLAKIYFRSLIGR